MTHRETAGNVVFFELTGRYLPIAIGFVLVLSFLLVTVLYRSLVVPIKAIIMRLHSVGAVYGLTVAVFQHGVGGDLLGLQRADKVSAWVPLYLLPVLFGRSKDYHVILISQIR